MAKKQINEYDKKQAFEKNCRPLLEELILTCRLFGIPCFFTACVKNTEEGSEYTTHVDESYSNTDFINDAVCPGSKGIELKDDQITRHLAVVAGFDVIPKRENLEITFDDIDELVDDEFMVPGENDEF